MKSIFIYSAHSSNKLNYVLKFFLTEQLGLSFNCTSNLKEFDSVQEGIKIAYTNSDKISADIIVSNSSYFDNFSSTLIPSFTKDLSFNEHGSSFDFFAATFYLLARVEEYKKGNRDEHGRFSSKQSILSKLDLLQHPIIDYWLHSFKKQLETVGMQNLTFSSKYKFISTLDVDHIFAFKHKPALIRIGSAAKALLSLNFGKFLDRFNDKDPFDKFEDILNWHKAHNLRPLFFILCASRSQYDKSLSPQHEAFISKIKYLNKVADIGIHPSYSSNSRTAKLSKEKADLEQIIEQRVVSSRQHYLKLTFPETYRNLLSLDITQDHSLGYHDAIGFRAGTARSFNWFDLERDEETSLQLVPFQVMDVTLKKYLHYDASQALDEMKNLITRIRKVNGHFSLLFHNSSFYDREGWEGWEEVYREAMLYAKA